MKSKYYTGEKVLNAKCPINFLVGNRSTGKSFYWKRYCVNDFLKRGNQFIYLRRNWTDILMSASNFFTDISVKFPNHSFEVVIQHNFAVMYIIEKENGEVKSKEICGYAMALSTLYKVKSISFEDVETIVYDEFIPENLRYLKPTDPAYEPNQLLSLYMTVARGYGEVIRPSVRIVCIANSITLFNPYFSFFNIDLTKQERVIVNNVYAERFVNLEIAEEIKNTKFGKILESTRYGKYALSNESLNDSYTNIAKHNRDCKPLFMIYFYKWYCVWVDFKSDYIYIGYSNDTTFKKRYKIVDLDEDSEDTVPWFTGDSLKLIRNLVHDDKVFYEDAKIKANLHGMFIPKIS